MSTLPAAVVVKRGGVLSALISGFFGLLTTAVLCGSGLAAYGLYLLDGRLGEAIRVGGQFVAGLPEWSERLPPALASVLSDRRAPEYSDRLDVRVQLVEDHHRRGSGLALVEVRNDGPETVTVLALNIVLVDEDQVPVGEVRTYAATPVLLPVSDWRGPILPGSSRTFARRVRGERPGVSARVEISELRVSAGGAVASTVK